MEIGRLVAADEVRGDLDGGGRVHDIKVLPCWTQPEISQHESRHRAVGPQGRAIAGARGALIVAMTLAIVGFLVA